MELARCSISARVMGRPIGSILTDLRPSDVPGQPNEMDFGL